MSTAGHSPLPVGTLVNEQYRVMGALGHGGLGTVYQVTEVHFGRANVYALKEQWDQSESARKQFLRERDWLKNLNHPHIPRVYDSFEWNGLLYIVMGFVDGENLEQKLERNAGRPLIEAQLIPWVLPICDALHYLHTRSPAIIHRDVKPANIIVTPADYPVLVDLGIAKEHASGAQATATFVRKAGTEGYAAPEQYSESGQTGPWSDVYGLGATLYHLLTARIPPTAVERVALDVRLRQPREFNPAVSVATESAILRALAIRPQDRFQSMAEFRQALPVEYPTFDPAAPAPSAPPAAGPAAPAPPPILTMPAGAAWPTVKPAPSGSGGLRPINRTAASAPVRASTLTPPASTPSMPRAGSSGGLRPRVTRPPRARARPATTPDDAAAAPAKRPLFGLGHPLRWGMGLAAAILIAAVAIVTIMHLFAPLDRSTPAATVNGYFSALQAEDLTRAWQCMTSSERGQVPEAQFDQGLRADDNLYGKVLTATIASSSVNADGSVLVTVSVVRSHSRTPLTAQLTLNQYGGLWLIDYIN